MIGGLSGALSFKNVNGSCLIDCTLNSILNSHEIIVKLYTLTEESTSLNNDFIKIFDSNEKFTRLAHIYKILLSAFVHDYIHETRHVDKDKLLFTILNTRGLGDCNDIREVGVILQEKYQRFNHSLTRRIDTFMLAGTHLAQMQQVEFEDCIKLYKSLSTELRHYKDIYIAMVNAPDEFRTVLDLSKSEIKVINGLFKAAITSTGEYLCTDIILYKGDDVNHVAYSHVVYYNVLDETLVDNNVKQKVPLRSLIAPSSCIDYVSYIEATDSHYVYVPCILHYQKITNDPKTLGLTGKLDDYESAYASRVKFVLDEISSYTEEWYQNKVNAYKIELTSR